VGNKKGSTMFLEKSRSFILLTFLFAIAIVGYKTNKSQGLPFRDIAKLNLIENFVLERKYFFGKYYALKNDTPVDYIEAGKGGCFKSKIKGDVEFMIIGDSHGEHLFPGFANNLQNLNVGYCAKYYLPLHKSIEFKDIFRETKDAKNIKFVFISARWITRFKNDIFFIGNTIEFKDALKETVEFLTKSGKKVYILNDTPSFSFDPKRCFINRRIFEKKCKEPILTMDNNSIEVAASLAYSVKDDPNAKLIDTMSLFCLGGQCSMAPEGINLFADQNHLNISGSNFVARKILEKNPEIN